MGIEDWSESQLRLFVENLILHTRFPKELPTQETTKVNDFLQFDGISWKGATVSTSGSPLTTKGDLYTHTAVLDTRLPVGTNGQLLSADSTQSTGLKWITSSVSVPTGTGFRHVTAGVEDAASKLVDTADINNAQVTLAKIQNIAGDSILGRIGIAGSAVELTGTNVTTMLDVFTSVLKGLVPLSGGGTTKYLRADATWVVPPTAPTFTLVEPTLVAFPDARRSGSFQISGLPIWSAGKTVLIRQANGPYTGKGNLADEAEMDHVVVTGKVVTASLIQCYWESKYRVRGKFKFDYLVGA